jgi:TonB family protein
MVRALFIGLLAATVPIGAAVRAQIAATPSYADSADGFRQQLEDLVSSYKSGDQTAFHAALDALAIPNFNDWIAAHFTPADAAKLQHDYPLSLDGFQRHATWVASNAAHLPGWEMTAKPSELPPPAGASAQEQAVPLPSEQIFVENFRYGPLHPEGETQRSWVNSFVYIDGKFRYVGGTYPFWWEDLQRIRRPEVSAMHVHAARLIRKVAPDYPKKARKQHIEGTVRIHVIIGKDGAPRSLTVVSGDELLAPAAIKAVQQWRYEPILLNGSPVEVDTVIDVIFQLNRKD